MDKLEEAGALSRLLIEAALEQKGQERVREALIPWAGEDRTDAFLKQLPQLEGMLKGDIQAAMEGDPAACSEEEIRLAYPGFRALAVQRMAHLLWNMEVPLLPRLMTEQAHGVTGIDIHPGARIGRNFFIDHGTGVVIGETAVIGDGVKLYQGVTLGGLSTRNASRLRGRKRHPTLGNQVTVYANATILGGDTVIGDGCVIGANVFLTSSVPSNTTVSMGKQPLQYDYRDSGCLRE